jgi:hypothetical protein
MKKIFTILFLVPIFAFSQVTLGQGKKLDDLLIKSGKIRQEGVGGFIIRQKSESVSPVLIPPEKLFKNVPVPYAEPTGQYVPYSIYINEVQKIDSLENQVSKMTKILDNLTENSGTMKNFMNGLTKFMEALSALLAAIGGIWGLLKFRKRPE